MSSKVNPVPEGFGTLTPHVVVKDGAKAIDFYRAAFGAEEVCRMPGPDGKGVMHAELRIGGSVFMLAEECGGVNRSPESLGGSCVTLHLYLSDAHAALERAVKAGATEVMPVQDMFWGDRYGKVRDPFGHEWSVATHIEDVPPDEMGKRAAAAFAQMGECSP